MYTKPNGYDLTFFAELLGASNVFTDSSVVEPYRSDKTKNIKGSASTVLRPVTTAEVSAILSYCNEKGLGIFTRGAGTGVTGGALPRGEGIVLSLERMNRIIEFDPENMTLTVEPCVITGEIHAYAEKRDLLYPPDPASSDDCSIGGNIAENAGGPRAVKYGVTGDYVLALEYVLADGTVITSGGKYVKNAAGYNIIPILVGSEGTLAVITRATLKLVPKPYLVQDALISFDTLDEAVNAVTVLLAKSPRPAAIEFMEDDAIKLVTSYTDYDIPFAEAGAHLLVRLEADSEELMGKQIKMLQGINSNILIARTDEESKHIWSARRGIRDAIGKHSPIYFAEDCVVPRASIADFIKSVKTSLKDLNTASILFGHAGDGNIHIDILRGALTDDQWEEKQMIIRPLLYKKAISFGGTITGEHGIGFIRKEYLEEAIGSEAYQLMKKIKRIYDPAGILNPGKIF
ncbi:MAG: FAD-binding oxidoreductase [Spirochaetes bacterium]|jgi:glycolate oxidase|nr:FAD-binding oxidoreductase [Spirochaetota bacterium]